MRRTVLAFVLLLACAVSAGDFSYMLTRDGNTIISGNVDLRDIERLTGRWNAPYLWVSQNGKQYLIHDAATLAQADAAFSDSHALHAEYDSLRRRMEPVEDLESTLERDMDKIGDDLSDRDDLSAAERRRMETKLEELEHKLAPVRKQLRALEAEEERLDEREEQLTAIAEKKLQEIVDRAIASGLARPAR